MTMTPGTAVSAFLESEHRLFDGPEVAVVDVSRVRARATSTTGAAGDRSSRKPSGPAAPPLRLHVVHLHANPPGLIGVWFCSWLYRYRRAVGDSRRIAFRRALACAQSHGGGK